MVSSFFVYGTLKNGQCRESCWPAKPLSITAAWTQGQLFSRADYPAMIAGSDKVTGELWTFADPNVDMVIRELDRIEETNQPGRPDLYRRVIVPVFNLDDEFLVRAYTYLYATDPADDGFTPVVGSPIMWPARPSAD